MQKLLGTLWLAAVCWAVSLLGFIAATVMAVDGWETNIGAGFALLIALVFGAVAQLLTFGALLIWAVWRIRDKMAEPYPPLRYLLWGATAVVVLALAMLLATGFEFGSPGVTYLLTSAVITGIAAAAVSVDDLQRSRHGAAG